MIADLPAEIKIVIFQSISERQVANERRSLNHGTICNFSGVTGPILIKFAQYVEKMLPLNPFESKLRQSNPLGNASMLRKGHLQILK